MSRTDRPRSPTWIRIRTLAGQFIKFGMVGVSNTVLSIVIYNGLLFFGVHYIIAYTVAFLISVVNAYVWNRKFVFKNPSRGKNEKNVKNEENVENGKNEENRKNEKKTFLKVFLSYGSTFLLGMGLLFLMVQYAGISKPLAQILLLAITIPVNFLLNKLWAFNEKI